MRTPLIGLGLIAALTAVSCKGQVTGGAGASPEPTPGTPTTPGTPGTPTTPGTPGTPAPELAPLLPAPASRVVRLTHAQWASSIRDLFQLDGASDLAATFRADAGSGDYLFGAEADARVVDEPLEAAYRRAAADVAIELTRDGDLSRLAAWLPEEGNPRTRARALFTALGTRVHRRPLSEEALDIYLSVFDTGVAHPQGAEPFVGGLRLGLEAMFGSPAFLYRIERSDGAGENGIPLDDWELASRLSFALWDSTPDEALLTAAAAGELRTEAGLRAQAERLVGDPRAASVNWDFHRALLDLDRYANIAPDPVSHPGVTNQLPQSAREETRRVIEEAFASGSGWKDLLTTSETWVDAELAALYGVEGPSSGFAKVSLPTSERRGLFTQVGFLAAHATRLQPDPIHRGVFLTKRIACNPLAAPPADLPPLPPPQGRTNRELVADHTEQPNTSCAGCHSSTINPYGFVMEGYDAAGRIRTEDNGQAVRTDAEPLLDGATFAVDGPLDLMDAMAASRAVHECYARHWLERTLGRNYRSEDIGLIQRLGARSRDGASIRELLVELVTSPAFTHRLPEEN